MRSRAPVSRSRPRNLDYSVFSSALSIRYAVRIVRRTFALYYPRTIAIRRMPLYNYKICRVPYAIDRWLGQLIIYRTQFIRHLSHCFSLHLLNSSFRIRWMCNCEFRTRFLLFCLRCHDRYSERIFRIIHLFIVK